MSVSQTNPAFVKGWGVRKILSADEEARLLAESREKARMDFEDRYDGAYKEGFQQGCEEGREQGRAQGRKEWRREIALKLVRYKMPFADIAEATGLSLAEVEQLAATLST